MASMFKDAIAFNQPLNDWDVSNVTIMLAMFEGASDFNQYLDNWDVRLVITMEDMFRNASSYNHPLHDWEIEQVTTPSNFLTGSNYGVSNYEKTLVFWGVNVTQNNVILGAGDLTCCNCTGRERLINEKNWQIFDGGKLCNRPYVFTIRTQAPNEVINSIGRPDFFGTFSVDWENDGVIDEVDVDFDMAGTLSHTYPKADDHQIAIYIDTWNLAISENLKEKYISIDQWGDVIWTHVEGCLLYTSPSPRDATLSRMPSSA